MSRLKSKGFTLVELLIVTSILGVLGLIIASTLTNVFRGQNKVNTISQIKQNGQTAMDQIERLVRFSEKVVCGGSGIFTDRIVVAKQGQYIRIQFIAPTTTANGYLFYDYPDQLSSIDPCTQPQNNSTVLTNTDLTRGISVVSANFNKLSQPGFKDALIFQFQANTSIGNNNLSENSLKDPIQFKTTIELR